jgi:hypothetical protein
MTITQILLHLLAFFILSLPIGYLAHLRKSGKPVKIRFILLALAGVLITAAILLHASYVASITARVQSFF